MMSLRLSHLVGDDCIDSGVTSVAAACNLYHDHVLTSCPEVGSAPRAYAAREHRWRQIEHLLFECQCISGLDSSVALALLQDDLFRVCSGPDHEEAVLLAALPSSRIPVVAATACVVPFLLDPAAALSRMSPWHMKSQCLDLVAAFLLGVSSAVCTRQPPTASVDTLSLACLVLRPCVVAPPADRVRFCPGALACARSCFARARPCAQGCCGRGPPWSGVMSDSGFFFLFFGAFTCLDGASHLLHSS